MFVISLFVSVAIVSSTKTVSNVPLLLWSDNSYFGRSTTIQQSVSETDFHKLMTDIITSQGHTELLDGSVSISKPKPEVIVAFVYDNLSSGEVTADSGSYLHSTTHSDFPLSNIKNMISSSPSSLSIPYLMMEKMSTRWSMSYRTNPPPKLSLLIWIRKKEASLDATLC